MHGHIEPGETAVDAARREMREETGLAPERLFNLSRVELFYLHRTDRVAFVPAFAAFVGGAAEFTLGPEHDAAEWLPIPAARERVAWPRVARTLEDIVRLVGSGSAGPLGDVLAI